jgi:hypothetical protein
MGCGDTPAGWNPDDDDDDEVTFPAEFIGIWDYTPSTYNRDTDEWESTTTGDWLEITDDYINHRFAGGGGVGFTLGSYSRYTEDTYMVSVTPDNQEYPDRYQMAISGDSLNIAINDTPVNSITIPDGGYTKRP